MALMEGHVGMEQLRVTNSQFRQLVEQDAPGQGHQDKALLRRPGPN